LVTDTKLVFDGPCFYNYEPYTFYSSGCSPFLLNEIFTFLADNESKLKQINIALYLFNNYKLFERLRALSEKGVSINVISIPLEGYDSKNPQTIVDYNCQNNFRENVSKYDLAKEIYDETNNIKNNFKLYIYDHIYLRSAKVKKFSRGAAPYSLHAKTFFIELTDNTSYSMLTSSNLAVRDLVKEELLLSFKNDESTEKSAKQFFARLIENSTINSSYNIKNILSKNHYQELSDRHERITNFYSAPFYEKSATEAGDFIKKIMRRANHRILIVAQHVTEFMDVLEDIDSNVDINIISQTYVDDTHIKKGQWDNYVKINGRCVKCRTPSNIHNFKKFAEQFKNKNIGNYYFNENIHLKYIVVDDTAIISTSNYTETQFFYDNNVSINKFENIPNERYHGTFCEVNQYVFLNKFESIANCLFQHFSHLLKQKDTVHAIEKNK